MTTPAPRVRRPQRAGRRRPFARWRLISPSGARVVSLRQIPPKDRFRVTLPSILTTANMACGFASVLLAFRGHYGWAAALVAISILFDIADGAVARKVGAMTPFGMELDSLADLVSFGLAPAVLIHTWALTKWPVLAWGAAFFWLACVAFRLARFNVTINPLADKRYFVGLPSPGAAAVVIATVFALGKPISSAQFIAPLCISVLPAIAMVTSVRFRSFRNLLSPRTQRAWAVTVLVGVAIVLGMILAPGWTGLVIAYGYALTPPLGVLTAPLRSRLLGPDSVAPPRYRLPSVFLPSEPLDEPLLESEEECDEDEELDLIDAEEEPRVGPGQAIT